MAIYSEEKEKKVKGNFNSNTLLFRIRRKIYKIWQMLSLKRLNIRDDQLFLLDIPTHFNIGDQAIVWAEKVIVNSILPNKNIIYINDNVTEYSILRLKDKLQANNLILFHGGGNMNDLWKGHDQLKTQGINSFQNQTIISFPQSVYYDMKKKNYDRINMFQALSNSVNNPPILFAREQNSYDFLIKYFPDNCKYYLVPDIVFYLSGKINFPQNERKAKITTFFRRDPEKKLDTKKIVNQIKSKYDLINSDTVNDTGNAVTRKQFKELVRDKWKEFYTSKLIITDRLHGMILAVITGTPAIVFDNSNHKIKSTYETWLKDLPYIHFIDGDNDQLDSMIEQMNKLIAQEENDPKEYEIPTFDDKFEPLIRVLKEAR